MNIVIKVEIAMSCMMSDGYFFFKVSSCSGGETYRSRSNEITSSPVEDVVTVYSRVCNTRIADFHAENT